MALATHAALSDGLVFYAPFSSSFNDIVGGKPGTAEGGAAQVPSDGIQGGYLRLVNSASSPEQRVVFPDVTIGTSDFTVQIWIRGTDFTAGQAQSDPAFISNKDWDSGGNLGWVIADGTGSTSQYQWNFNTTAQGAGRRDFDPSGVQNYQDGLWHQIVVTHKRDGAATFYFDGTPIGAVDIAPHAAGNVNGAGLNLGLGTDGTGSYDHGDGSSLNGDLDEAALWNRALTDEEVAALFNEGQGVLIVQPTTPSVSAAAPLGGDIRADAAIQVTIEDAATEVDVATVKLFFDDQLANANVNKVGTTTTVAYDPPGMLASGTPHSYRVEFSDKGVPVTTKTNVFTFRVANYVSIPAAYAKPITAGVTRGMTCRTVAAGVATLPNSLARTRAQLNGTLIDPSTGLPYPNVATPGPNPDGSYDIDVVNFEQAATSAGLIPGDQAFPGLAPQDHNAFAIEAIAYVQLAAGYHRWGVTSDDGFEVSVGTPPAGLFSSAVLGAFDGGRGPGETAFDFHAPADGIYCMRLIYEEGDGGASVEFYSFGADGQRVLINDPANENAVVSYRVLSGVPMPPYVRETRPAPGARDVRVETALGADIVDGATALVPGTVQMLLNGSAVTPLLDKVGTVTTLSYQPPSPLAYRSTNTVVLIFGDGAMLVTNQWTFSTRAADQRPGITGQWDFDRGDLSATIGLPLDYLGGPSGPTATETTFGTTTSFGIPDIDGLPAQVMRFPGAVNRQIGYIMSHGALPNGADTATKVNQWTLILDLLIVTPGWFSFIQIDNLANGNDGDLFVNPANGIGISGSYQGSVTRGEWHRVAFAVDATTVISKFVNGEKVADQTSWSSPGLDGRHALLPTSLLFADEDGESQAAFINSIQIRNYKMRDHEIAALGRPSPFGIPTVSGQWDFDAADFTATIGSDLMYRPDTEFFTAFESATIGGEPAQVMHFTGSARESGYILPHGAQPNGGGQFVNQYTLIMDLMYPASSGGFRSLFQTATNNANDGDLFVNGGHGIGISSQYQGRLEPDRWHRVAFTVDLTKRELGKFMNGSNVLTGPVGAAPLGTGPYQYLSSGVDGRWALFDTALLLADEDGELAPGYANSIQFRVGVLSPQEIGLLGGPSAAGIPVTLPVPPRLSITSEFNEYVISWPAGFTDYILESASGLNPPVVWTEVPGVVNNSVSVSASQAQRYFRLRK